MLRGNVALSSFKICQSFEHFVANIALIDQVWEHMDELNLTEIRLLTDNRDAVCEELCKCVVEIRNSVNGSNTSDRRGHKRQLTSQATATYATDFTCN